MTRVALLSLLTLIGCAGTRPIAAGTIRAEYQQAVNVAIAEWNAALGCRALERDDSAKPAFARVRELDSGGRWAARSRVGLRAIDIAPDTVGPYAVRALEHEIGHMLGLQHTNNPVDLMFGGAPFQMRGPESTGLRCSDLR